MTLSRGFGGILIGQEILGIVLARVWPSIKIVMPSPASGGPYNVMNILSMTSMALEGFSNAMNVLTMMVGVSLT